MYFIVFIFWIEFSGRVFISSSSTTTTRTHNKISTAKFSYVYPSECVFVCLCIALFMCRWVCVRISQRKFPLFAAAHQIHIYFSFGCLPIYYPIHFEFSIRQNMTFNCQMYGVYINEACCTNIPTKIDYTKQHRNVFLFFSTQKIVWHSNDWIRSTIAQFQCICNGSYWYFIFAAVGIISKWIPIEKENHESSLKLIIDVVEGENEWNNYSTKKWARNALYMGEKN